MSVRAPTPEQLKRSRERNAGYVSDFLSAVHPELSDSEIHATIAGISDERLSELASALLKKAMEDGLSYSANVFSLRGWFLDMEFPGALAVKGMSNHSNFCQNSTSMLA